MHPTLLFFLHLPSPDLPQVAEQLVHQLLFQERAGKYLGFTNLATAGSAAIARLEGPVLDWLNHTWPGAWIGYKALFIFGAAAIFLSAFLLKRIDIKIHDNQPEMPPAPP